MTHFDRVRVGLVGYGIGTLYATALQHVGMYYAGMPPVDLVEVATSSEASGRRAMERSGFQRATTDYRELFARDDINTLVIATPHYLHHEMLLAALRTDKAIYTDKPLANNLAEARAIVGLARELGRDAQLSFQTRYSPALLYAHELIQSGRLGSLYSFRASYYRSSYSNPEKSLNWKASLAKSGGGVISDLVPHLTDLIIWLVGMPEQVSAQMRTFIHERPRSKSDSEIVEVETDDHVIIQAALPGGTIGTIEAGRLITGAISNISIEIYGSEGSLRWNFMDPNYLYLADRRMPENERGWIQLPTVQRYPDAIFPGPDAPVGGVRFTIACIADFLRKTLAGSGYDPGLEQGLRVQAVIEAAIQASREGNWQSVSI